MEASSSRLEVFCEKGIIKNFVKYTGKYLRKSLFLIKLQALASNLNKNRLWQRCFTVNFAKFLRTTNF